MKTASVRALRNQFSEIATWLEQGETVLLTRRGKTLGRIIPEPPAHPVSRKSRNQLFAERFAPLPKVPRRDLTSIVSANRDRS